MKKSLFLGIIIGLLVFMSGGFKAHAETDVGGIIYSDTTWTFAGSPYNLTEKVQTDVGVILTIEPGVVVNGNGYGIELTGELNAIGSETSKITLNGLRLFERESTANVNIQFAVINGAQYYFCQNSSSFTLRDSKVIGSSITIFSSDKTSFMERNMFINVGSIKLESAYAQVRNNVFYGQTAPLTVEVDNAIVEYNSFLSTDRIVIVGQFGFSAINNFWNTTDTAVIDDMIYDGKDDLGYPIINYIPFLAEPHPDTPIPDFNQPPTADCGNDRVVFDEVTLDGSASTDPEGSELTYYWSLQHTNPVNNSTSDEVKPTISGLAPGFYNACLSVTDNLGTTDIDCCLLAAAGSCSCTPTSIHVESITPTLLRGTKGQSFGQVTVLVSDDCGNPVTSVYVEGTFSGDYFNETLNVVTGADGTVILTTTAEAKKPTYTFCVDSLDNALDYDPSKNIEDCDGLN
jgi:hypothetical protein